MSVEPPTLPAKFDWPSIRASIADWAFRIQRSQRFVPPGTIAAFGAATAPEGWVKCDGTLYSTAKFPELYKVVGTTFGSGAGTFGVPNLAATWANTIWVIKV